MAENVVDLARFITNLIVETWNVIRSPVVYKSLSVETCQRGGDYERSRKDESALFLCNRHYERDT